MKSPFPDHLITLFVYGIYEIMFVRYELILIFFLGLFLLHVTNHIDSLYFRVCFEYQEDHQWHVIDKGSSLEYQWKGEL